MLQLMNAMYYISPKNRKESVPRTANFYEVELYTGGNGFSVIDGVDYAHTRNDVLISVPGNIRYSKKSFECHSFKFVCDGDELFIKHLEKLAGVHNMPNADELYPLFERLYVLSATEKKELLIDATMRSIIAIIEDSLPSKDAPFVKHKEELALSESYMRENLNQKLTLAKIAATAHMSPSFFHSCFKAQYGMSPNEYLTVQRIKYAKALLHNNSLSVEQIVEMCGFSSRAYFDVCFKKNTGVSPAVFRKNANKDML